MTAMTTAEREYDDVPDAAGRYCFIRQSGCMQLQCNSTCGAFLQYSLQNFVPAGTTQWQLGCAHF